MSALVATISITTIVLVGTLIVKKYKSQPVLVMAGLFLMAAAYLLGVTSEFVPKKNALGLVWFDMFENVSLQLAKDAANLGLQIMAITGFAKYMDKIGASSTLVMLAMKPLGRFHAPYAVMAVSFLFCMCLAIFIPSASGLAMLMMVTVFPVLTALGVSRVGAASVVSTGHLLDIGPASATTALVAKTAEMDIAMFFVDYQLRVYVICGIAACLAHYFWQKYLDKREAAKLAAQPAEAVAMTEKDMDGVAPPGPIWFAILPTVPLMLLIGCSEYGFKSIKMNVVTAMLISLTVAVVFEFLRQRSLKKTLDSIQAFFKGMGDQFALTITLIVAGQTFAFGLKAIGFVDQLISGSQSLGLESVVIVFLMCAVIIAFSIIMGSGVAPMFAFAPLMPNIAKGIGGNLPEMLLALQNSASLGRLLSPITAVIVAVSSLARVAPVELVVRNSVPVIVAMLTSWAMILI